MASKYGPLKRGVIREDGRIFLGYIRGKEAWASKESFNKLRVRQRAHDRSPTTVARKKAYWVRESKKDPKAFILRNAKGRAKKLGVPFNITKEDIVIPDTCPILGIPLFRGSRKLSDNSPSLDRLRPDLGYVKGNIFVISKRANQIKNCGTSREHLAIANWMERIGHEGSR